MFKFDWLDPKNGTQYSPETIFTLKSGNNHLRTEFEIPFCPEQVSVHFDLQPFPGGTTGEVTLLDGLFVHECMVPEASETALLMGVGALGFGMILWYRKPRTA